MLLCIYFDLVIQMYTTQLCILIFYISIHIYVHKYISHTHILLIVKLIHTVNHSVLYLFTISKTFFHVI